MKKEFTIGNITKIKWHYRNKKYGYQAWGHMRETFDENSYITIPHPTLKHASHRQLDTEMCPNKYYAYVEINKDNKLHIRNLFDSKHEKGFEQKNTYFKDAIYYDLFLDDTSNLLNEYLKLGNETKDNNRILHFGIEYQPNYTIDLDLILYYINLENNNTILQDKINEIEVQNILNKNKSKKSYFSFWNKNIS